MQNDGDRHALVEASCAFWFNDNEQVRSPFPEEIQQEARDRAEKEYLGWLGNLTESDHAEVSDDEMVSVFEGFLFAEALKLIGNDAPEAVLTLHYPLMPRVDDLVNDEARGESRVMRRQLEVGLDKKPYMVVSMQTVASKEAWQTKFMLPP
jgi:hypothetical protein|tara:strand:+ start:5570 stop:6022 length:453 start_codon:yes stop_codon:yes gene_type:complete